jgi:K+-transporting ATPase ATPase C chain
MMNAWVVGLRLFLWMSVLLGGVYPLVVTGVAMTMQDKAAGSLVVKEGKVVGSALLAQKFSSEKYFWPRPSFGEYNPLASGGSNLGPTSAALKKMIMNRAEEIEHADAVEDISLVPAEMLFASGSGLDPHLSPEAAYFQVARVAKARGLKIENVREMVDAHTKTRFLGVIGEPVVNVLLLNIALDEKK